MTPEALSYRRVATKAKDGHDGFLYLHVWATGFQYLVFSTKEKAEEFRKKLNK